MSPPVSVNLATPSRALAIGAHPDDIEFGCGGTLAKWAAAGCTIVHVVCTDGSKGSWDPDEDPARLAAARRDEQRAASRALGGSGEVLFLSWPDGELEAGARERTQVAAAIRRYQPDVVLGHDPWKRYRLHPDHRNAGYLTTDGVVAARDPLFLSELALAAHRPSTILLFEADEPDHLEDITPTIDKKISALLEHTSQLRSTMHIDSAIVAGRSAPDVVAFERGLRERHSAIGEPAGFAFAEAFKRIDET
jgi:LmbE family N-acetylglucosaminyl deacetylase